jgi:heptaprenyl diphosphate synthase
VKNREDKVAFFAGLAAFLGVAENFIPMPVPFLKLGLSNIPVCLGFTVFTFRESLFIVLFKVVVSHLFKGTLFSYLFLIGLSGNILFLLIGFPFYHLFKKHISFVSLSLISAISHNAGQILMAYFFVPAKPLYFIALLFLILGVVFGFVNGVICNIMYSKIFERLLKDEK